MSSTIKEYVVMSFCITTKNTLGREETVCWCLVYIIKVVDFYFIALVLSAL